MHRAYKAARYALVALLLGCPAAFFMILSVDHILSLSHEYACDTLQGRGRTALQLFGGGQWETVRSRQVDGRRIDLRFAPAEGCVWGLATSTTPGDVAWLEKFGTDPPGRGPQVLGWKRISNGGTFLPSYGLPPRTEYRICIQPVGVSQNSRVCTERFSRPVVRNYRNLIDDPDFERQPGSGTLAPPWGSRGSAKFIVKSGGGHGGGRYLTIEIGGGQAAEAWSEAHQTVAVEARRSYSLRGFINPKPGLGRGCIGVREAGTGALLAAFVFDTRPGDYDRYRKIGVSVTTTRAENLVVFVGVQAPATESSAAIDQVTFSTLELDGYERAEIAESAAGDPPQSVPAEWCGG